MNETTEITATEDPHLKDGWRPIATAPKNGARIWLFAPHIRESAIKVRGWFDLQDGIDAGRWYEDPDFGTRPSGWTSPQVGWKQDNSEIMAANQDCYVYWKPITRAEELELAAIEGWRACMQDVKKIIRPKWGLDSILDGIDELKDGDSDHLNAVHVELNEQAKLNVFQLELEALQADIDRGYLTTDQVVDLLHSKGPATKDTVVTWPATKDIVLPRDDAGRTPDPFAFVLGLALEPWKTSGIANLLRDSGEVDIPTKAEAEMAAALHWLLGLVFTHGEYWEDPYSDEIARMRAIVEGKKLAVAS